MNIVPQYLADVFYLPSSEWSKKSYKPWIITKEEQLQIKREKARKEEQDKKQETKLPEGKNKNKSRGKQNGRKQSPQKCPQRASGLKFRQNLK